MYDRFTDAARAVVARAEAEAFARGATQVDPEDVVVALAGHEGVGGSVLRAMAADVAALRAGVTAIAPPADLDPSRARPLPLSHASAGAFSIAAREADGLRHELVGTEHLLLGLLREPTGRAGTLLLAVRRDPGGVRERILDLVSTPGYVSPEVPAADVPGSRDVDDDDPRDAGDASRAGASRGSAPLDADDRDLLRALLTEVGGLRAEVAALRDELRAARDDRPAGGAGQGRHIA